MEPVNRSSNAAIELYQPTTANAGRRGRLLPWLCCSVANAEPRIPAATQSPFGGQDSISQLRPQEPPADQHSSSWRKMEQALDTWKQNSLPKEGRHEEKAEIIRCFESYAAKPDLSEPRLRSFLEQIGRLARDLYKNQPTDRLSSVSLMPLIGRNDKFISANKAQKPVALKTNTPSAAGVVKASSSEATQEHRINRVDLEGFTSSVLQGHGVSPPEADITAKILVAADLRGIPSHGIARLGRYVDGIKKGIILPGVSMDINKTASTIATVNANNGIGQVAAERAMNLAIDMAKDNGVGIVTVRDSNHFGIAGYYANMAVEKGMIGIALTNSAPLVVPTFGASAQLGTNPIAFGAPASRYPAFLIDMATSVTARGKIEVYNRNQKQIPIGWTVDEKGLGCQDPGHVLKNLIERAGGGILPLGGHGEQLGGHKGFGLPFMVDILSGVLSGSAFGVGVDNVHGSGTSDQKQFPRVGHYFMAIDVEKFMPLDEFRNRMDSMIEQISESPKAEGQNKIYIHGEKEYYNAINNEKEGVPVTNVVYESLAQLGKEKGITPPGCLSCYQKLPSFDRHIRQYLN